MLGSSQLGSIKLMPKIILDQPCNILGEIISVGSPIMTVKPCEPKEKEQGTFRGATA
jgi:hypothetical protein